MPRKLTGDENPQQTVGGIPPEVHAAACVLAEEGLIPPSPISEMATEQAWRVARKVLDAAKAVEPHPFTEEQFEKAGVALVPFVERWHLSLNPEQLDEMVYAVFTNLNRPGDLKELRVHEEIERAVNQQLDEFAARWSRDP